MNSSTLTWSFGQPWLQQTEPAFAPGKVAVSLFENELIIHAELVDSHPMQDVFPLNFPAFTKCDAFEIFLGPVDEKAYYELHVTPSNSLFQLYFESPGKGKPVEELLFTSETVVMTGQWSIKARIQLKELFPGEHPEWLLSFGRYDYTPGTSNWVVSSTSQHSVCNFHDKHEWRKVRLADLSLGEGSINLTAERFAQRHRQPCIL